MLWVDKYRPTSLDKISYHVPLAERLSRLAESADLPHMMFYGPSGAGKKTRIMALLRKVFGPGVEKMKLEHRTFKTPSGKAIEVTTVASAYHIEINPGDAGIHDRFVVQEVIKEIAQYNPLERSFKVVLLSDVDRLTKEAQHALRRTMEKYTASCRLILCCESPSRVIDPVRSRCLGIRIAAPSTPEIMEVLDNICKREGLMLPRQIAAKLATNCKGNLRRAILMLESSKVQRYPFAPDQAISAPDWERYCSSVVTDICTEQSPKQLLVVRSKLYQLLINCIPATVIIKTVCVELSKRADSDAMKHDVVKWGAFYEHRLLLGQKDEFHLEAYVAKCMSLAKTYHVLRYGA